MPAIMYPWWMMSPASQRFTPRLSRGQWCPQRIFWDAAAPAMVDPVALICNYFSDWPRIKKSVAVMCKVTTILKDRASRKKCGTPSHEVKSYRLTMADFEQAERTILRWAHRTAFPSDVNGAGRKQLLSTEKAPLHHLTLTWRTAFCAWGGGGVWTVHVWQKTWNTL